MGTSTTVRVVRAALFGTAAVLLWAQPGSAAASEYAINACQADRANFSPRTSRAPVVWREGHVPTS